MLNDRFSAQVHLAPAPVVAGISIWTAVLRPDITAGLARKVAGTGHLEAVGAPVVGNSRELPPGPHERDGLAMTFTEWAPPDPDRDARGRRLRRDAARPARGPSGLSRRTAVARPVHEDVPYGLAALER